MAATRVRNITFNTGRIKSMIRGAKKSAMTQLARELQAAIRKTISRPYPPPSRPGRPPKRRTGVLRNSTFVEFRGSKLVVRVPQYGIFLEGGTSRMRPRPFILPELQQKRREWERRARVLMRKFVKKRKG